MFVNKDKFQSSETNFTKDAEELTDHILNKIPILKFSKVKVKELTKDSIKLGAPLSENRNHYGTAFGGSISTLAVVAGWAIFTYKTKKEDIPAKLVIKTKTTNYFQPIETDFYAYTKITDKTWNEFKKVLSKKGKAPLVLKTQLIANGKICAEQKGIYIAHKA